MIQVGTFGAKTLEALEETINFWIVNHHNHCEVIDVKYAVGGLDHAHYRYSAMVIYKLTEKKND